MVQLYMRSLTSVVRLFVASLLVLLSFTVPGSVSGRTPAQTVDLPAVRYDIATGIITVGDDYDSDDTAEAPYVGFPSHPDAPKSTISIPQLAAELATLGHPDLLVNQGGRIWLLSADLVIAQNAQLAVTAATIDELRLDSTPNGSIALTSVTAEGGHLLIEGVRVVSWDTQANDVDSEYVDGRSYLLALDGGRMDVIDAEIAYLGWSAGEPSGLSWRKRGTQDDPQTGSTGSIIRSNIHHNYFGQYAYEAYGIDILYSEVHNNIEYGIDPHDYSFNFEVAYNRVYENGNHGIIFSRGCENNWIHNNEVYNNDLHGIMLDRGTNNNRINDNIVYNNVDGIAIFQSSNNLIENNELRDNVRGIRVNATYDNDDIFDGISTGNTISGNTITHNTQYGIYFYERADRNTISRNTISGNRDSGVYIKTGENTIESNIIRENGHGITIIGGENTPFPPSGPAPVPAASEPGYRNVLIANTIEDNVGMGVQIKSGIATRIGPMDPSAAPDQGNLIRTNGSHGIRLSEGTSDTAVLGNSIHANDRDGVHIRGADSLRNRVSHNSITANTGQAISLSDDANAGLQAPTITSALDDTTITGTGPAGATIEIYRDQRGEGLSFTGVATADADGNWRFSVATENTLANGGFISVLAIDANGNTSAFASNAPAQVDATYEIGAGRNGELTVFVSGDGAVVTLPEMQAALQVISPTVDLLVNEGNGVWQANAGIFIGRGVRLEITAASGVSWLKLRSQGSDIALRPQAKTGDYNYDSFVIVRTHNGEILIDGVRITSWDPTQNDYDRDISNGRSYLLAKYDARMDILNSTISYLGSPDGESYGISWRDTNGTQTPDVLRTRVTGDVIDSIFNYNYYGIYTYQAANMVFRGNKFHNNISYGFDPHDFSNNFLVENNEAYENGNHGFIISRGCNNFIFRNNKSYNNRYSVDERDRNAHGFMLDPGSPNSRYPQEASFENILENNQAWGNDGYGLRVLGSVNNIIRNNDFRDNLQGITLEQGSTGNQIENNTLSNNSLYGVYLVGGSDANTLRGNTISGSGRHGIYIKTGYNTIVDNDLRDNGGLEFDRVQGAGIAFLPETTTNALTDLILPGERRSLGARNPELLADNELTSVLKNNQIRENVISGNADDGIEVKGALDTLIVNNTVSDNGDNGVYLTGYNGLGAVGTTVQNNVLIDNGGRGIRANGADSIGNIWIENSVTGNAEGGIWNTSGANNNLAPPVIANVDATGVAGVTVPGGTVEIFSDYGFQGLYFEGRVIADANGNFQLASDGWQAPNLNAYVTVAGSGSSGFSTDRPASDPTPTNTPTATATNTPTNTPTATATNTPTATATNTPTNTPTESPTAINTPTSTPTESPTATSGPAPAPDEFTIFLPLVHHYYCQACVANPTEDMPASPQAMR